jgi:hypothetical protein
MTGMRFERAALLLMVAALTPLLMGAGGGAPPPFDAKIVGITYTFSAVMDPHESEGDLENTAGDVTPRAKQATIRIHRGNSKVADVAAVFKIRSEFALFRGCDLNLTDARFLYPNGKLGDWIPFNVLQALFNTLGETIDPASRVPVITRITDERCSFDPQQPSSISNGGDGDPSLPGVLSLEGAIRFAVPR